MRNKLAEYKANTYTLITLEAIAKTLESRKKHKTLTLSNTIHITLATTLNIPLLTSDKTI